MIGKRVLSIGQETAKLVSADVQRVRLGGRRTGSRVPWNVITFPPFSLYLPKPSTALDQVEIPTGSTVFAYSRSATEKLSNDRVGSWYTA